MNIFLENGYLKCEDRDKNLICGDLSKLAFSCNFRSEEFALELGLSIRQLQRLFGYYIGTIPSDWLKQQKMVRSRQMLLQGYALRQVMKKLGYKYPTHFYRDFQKHFRVTPVKFIKEILPIKFEYSEKTKFVA